MVVSARQTRLLFVHVWRESVSSRQDHLETLSPNLTGGHGRDAHFQILDGAHLVRRFGYGEEAAYIHMRQACDSSLTLPFARDLSPNVSSRELSHWWNGVQMSASEANLVRRLNLQ